MLHAARILALPLRSCIKEPLTLSASCIGSRAPQCTRLNMILPASTPPPPVELRRSHYFEESRGDTLESVAEQECTSPLFSLRSCSFSSSTLYESSSPGSSCPCPKSWAVATPVDSVTRLSGTATFPVDSSPLRLPLLSVRVARDRLSNDVRSDTSDGLTYFQSSWLLSCSEWGTSEPEPTSLAGCAVSRT
jgi:hypothetical protein